VPSWWPALYGGFEGNLGPWGKGISYVSCCDENNIRWQFSYKKTCWGFGLGLAISGGHVTNMSGSNCRYDRYEGYFVEITIQLISGDYGKNDVNDLGIGVGVNLPGIMVCKYEKYDIQKLGCCGN
jgi:hypothetical protein